MTGPVCLQGGGEFSPGCRTMDAQMVRRVAGGATPVRVVVVALAAAPGREHDTAAANGVAHYRRLGADAVAAPDARAEPAGAVAVLSDARLVVLPGGSPSRLLGALHETPVGDLLLDLAGRGVGVSGASAGAMVLCGWTMLPDVGGAHGPAVARGLGLVPGAVVLPHWDGDSGRGDWLRAICAEVPDGTAVLGLPEESGVVVEGRHVTAVGRTATSLLRDEQELLPGWGWQLPADG